MRLSLDGDERLIQKLNELLDAGAIDLASIPGVHEATMDGEIARFTVEAEWAHGLHPNFQIDVQQGECCLSLGEGAGGDHFDVFA